MSQGSHTLDCKCDACSPRWDDSEGDHPTFTLLDWQQEVAEGNTRLGYAEWVAHQLEAEA